jgi:predicted acetyltransferase
MNMRKAVISDCNRLSKVKHDVWLTTYKGIYDDNELDNYDYEYHKTKFENKIEELYVIEDLDNIIGYFSFGVPRHKYLDHTHCINSLYILDKYQRKGIGREVFKYINDYCASNNINKYFVNCNKYNEKALGFYLKMGGVITKLDDSEMDKASHQYYIEYKRS